MSRPLHLTTGPIMSQLMGLALPLLLANVLQQLYNIANSLVVTWYLGESIADCVPKSVARRIAEYGLYKK